MRDDDILADLSPPLPPTEAQRAEALERLRTPLLAAQGHAIDAHDHLQAICEDGRLPSAARDAALGLRMRVLTLARKLEEEARRAGGGA